MNFTNNRLSNKSNNILHGVEQYLDKPIFMYGSVQRYDYVLNRSDIDVDIFTDNETQTSVRLQHYLNIPKNRVSRIILKIDDSDTVITGTKMTYVAQNSESGSIEFMIFDCKYKTEVLNFHLSKCVIPMFATVILVILKFAYYRMRIIPIDYFKNIKNYVMNNCMRNNKNATFIKYKNR